MSEKVRLHGGPFVPGEVYRTRGGEEMVFVGEMPKWVAVNVEDRLVFTGRSGSLSRYYENGEYDTGCPGIYDIVVPVEEEPPVNIDLPVSIPPDVKCVKVNGVEFRRVAESD